METYDLEAQHPDVFVRHLIDLSPSAVVAAARTLRALWKIRPPVRKPGERIFDCHPRTVCRIVARLAERAGLCGDFSGHSPRIGMAQDLARLGVSLPQLQIAGRWKDPTMPAYYICSMSDGESAVAQNEKFLELRVPVTEESVTPAVSNCPN